LILNIDDEIMGCFRIPALSKIGIERPATTDKKFTFVKKNFTNSSLASLIEAVLIKDSDSYGFVSVSFYPEMEHNNLEYPSLKHFASNYIKSN
jgi:hypothetical protein